MLFVFPFSNAYAQTQNIGVSITPEPPVSDFQAVIASDKTGAVSQETTITYTFTYGSDLPTDTPITLEAGWSLGTIEGVTIPEVEIADYVVGSASNAYGSVPAVVSLTDRTITWTIPYFPAQTKNQTVTFQLRTNDNYVGDKNVTFNTYGKVIYSPDVIAVNQTANIYTYNPNLLITGPTPLPTSAAAVVLPPAELKFNNIYVKSLSSDKAVIGVELNQNVTLKVYYGKSIKSLSGSLVSLQEDKTHDVDIGSLKPNTVYYVQIVATAGTIVTKSDVFSFKTPALTAVSEVDNSTVIISANDVFLATPDMLQTQKRQIPIAVIPKDTAYEFRFKMKQFDSIVKIQVSLENSNVLGASFPGEQKAQVISGNVIQINPGAYRCQLKTPSETGSYELVARVFDKNGNISEQKISDIRIVNEFTVLNEDGKTGVEGARVLISYQNPSSNTFEIIPFDSSAIENPSFTDQNGEDDLVLPFGRYSVTIQAIGYKTKTVEFVMGQYSGEEYPAVRLESDFSPVSVVQYYISSLAIFIDTTKAYLNVLSTSNQFFELNALSALLLTVIITIFMLCFHTKIPLRQLHSYFYDWLKQLFSNKQKHILGRVLKADGSPETEVNVFLMDPGTNLPISEIHTNRFGEFHFKNIGLERYQFIVNRKGVENRFSFNKEQMTETDKVILKTETMPQEIKSTFKHWLDLFLGIIIFYLIFICLFFEFLLGYSFGWLKVSPFAIVSIINLVIWIKFYKTNFEYL